MFINMKKLNEGFGKDSLSNLNSIKFCEGENPKNEFSGNETTGWQKTESSSLVNQSWEKLRK